MTLLLYSPANLEIFKGGEAGQIGIGLGESRKSQCNTQNMTNLLQQLEWSLTESEINRTQFDPSTRLQGAHQMGVRRKRESRRVIMTGSHIIGSAGIVTLNDQPQIQGRNPDWAMSTNQ